MNFPKLAAIMAIFSILFPLSVAAGVGGEQIPLNPKGVIGVYGRRGAGKRQSGGDQPGDRFGGFRTNR